MAVPFETSTTSKVLFWLMHAVLRKLQPLEPQVLPERCGRRETSFLLRPGHYAWRPLTEMQRIALREWNKLAHLLARILPHTPFTEGLRNNMLHLASQAFDDYFFCGALRKENWVTIGWTDIPPKRSRYGETAYWPNDDTRVRINIVRDFAH